MRWTLVFFIVCFFIIINSFISAQITGETVTGEVVTGEVAAQTMDLNISVISTPSLTLISPENETYITNKNLLLNYSVSGADYVWYKLDSGMNITISSAIYFNTSNNVHTLYLYANNSQGTTAKSVTFTANSSKLQISNNKWNGSTKGSSTNFNAYSYEDLQNLSNVILEHTTFGKMLFLESINVTDDSNSSDEVLDLDSYINISQNRIEVNSTALPNFNKQATLSLYGLSFNNPRILRDGALCPSVICTGQAYSGNVLTFNVTGFSVYSSEETPVESSPSPSSSGGGGGGGIIKSFTITPEEVKISLKQGAVSTKEIEIKNELNKQIDVSLEVLKIGDLIKISEKNFKLNAKESKKIILDVFARGNTVPDLYIGKILVKGGSSEEEILLLVEVESEQALFDVRIDIPEKYLSVFPGDDILAKTSLFNLGVDKRRIDVNLEYIIKSEQGEEIIRKDESVAVETSLEHLVEMKLPEDIEIGNYIFYVKATYNGNVAISSTGFSVGEPLEKEKIYIVFMVFFILIVIAIFYYLKMAEKHKTIKKIGIQGILNKNRIR